MRESNFGEVFSICLFEYCIRNQNTSPEILLKVGIFTVGDISITFSSQKLGEKRTKKPQEIQFKITSNPNKT